MQGVAQTHGAGSSVPTPRMGPDGFIPLHRASASVRSALSGWTRRLPAVLFVLDAVISAVAAAVVLSVPSAPAAASQPLSWTALSLVAGWPGLLAALGAYSDRTIGAGSDEFRQVGRAGLVLMATVGFLSHAAALDVPRSFVVYGLPALVATTLVGRCLVRWRLQALRARGVGGKRVVVVGRGGAVLDMVAQLERDRRSGLQVVATCVTPDDRTRVGRQTGLPVGGLDDVLTIAAEHGAETVAVTSASETAAQYLRRLSWQLDGTGLELLVAPGLIDVAGPRLHIRPLEGLPLLYVEQPRFEGWQRLVKGGVDRIAAAVALVVLAPVLLGIGLAVAISDGGPVLYRQERVGVGGRTFTMLKFRSMVTDADRRLDALKTGNISDGLLFKMREDPRVTPVGRWLRRLSLDELPQLINVLTGSMSLVGPRPPLPSEVEQYDTSIRRRLLVKPGLTGLWQISGRSDLSWEESVRLDLRYVENWSLAVDSLILWKTASAVLRSRGAY
jgi:exopolysaccharide biosynthesis polyprenyl glycosylphosphotransferase